MVKDRIISINAEILGQELEWFSELLDTRLKLYFGHECSYASVWDIAAPELSDREAYYVRFVQHYNLRFEERALLILALIPHIKPQLLDVLWVKNSSYDRGFTEFGGIKGNAHGGFLPTAETAMFILAANNLELRFYLSYLFEGQHFFESHNILKLKSVDGEPLLSGALTLSREYVDYFTTGKSRKPNFSIDFPARLIHTKQDWEDLFLPPPVLEQIEEIKAWMTHGDTLMNEWNLGKIIKPGYRGLFYGPSGTGKSLTACLLGKYCNSDVYRIDLSQIVSKYIGETEKNLAKVFDLAEHKGWILFFDEADALFGKRSNVNDAHDRYANQEVSYLLQRIEDFNGVIILATNLKQNIDEAFTRRFQSIIYFPLPRGEERLKIWKNSLSSESVLDEKINLQQVANKYELTGGTIINVVRYCSLMALRRNENVIRLSDLEEGIKKEYRKEGRMS